MLFNFIKRLDIYITKIFYNRIYNKFLKNMYKKVFLDFTKSNNNVNVYGPISYGGGVPNIKFGNNLTIYSNVAFRGDGDIIIGDNVEIGDDTIIYASKNAGVYIGDNVSIAAHCYIIDSDHGIKKDELINKQPLNSKKIIIGNDVWIADNCTILKGSIIGDGAVIGAKSLVNKELPENSINVGIPAKTIKYRE